MNTFKLLVLILILVMVPEPVTVATLVAVIEAAGSNLKVELKNVEINVIKIGRS